MVMEFGSNWPSRNGMTLLSPAEGSRYVPVRIRSAKAGRTRTVLHNNTVHAATILHRIECFMSGSRQLWEDRSSYFPGHPSERTSAIAASIVPRNEDSALL